MRAYHGDPTIKEKYLARVRQHRAADELVRGATEGRTATGFRGCAVVCTIEAYDHGAYERELGIPRVLARLEDRLFESMPVKEAMDWPERFLASIQPGADLTLVWPKFAVWLLMDPVAGVVRFAKTNITRRAIESVGKLYQLWCDGKKPALGKWKAASSAAYAAYAASSASSAAYAAYAASSASSASYAASSAYYAYYAAYAASSAAYAAYAAYAASSAASASSASSAASRKIAFSRQAEKLLELMAAAPTPKAAGLLEEAAAK